MLAVVSAAGFTACESTDTVKVKKRPPLPGENDSELSWNKPGPNDMANPMGIPMSH